MKHDSSAVELNPLAYERTILTLGTDGETESLLQRFGRTTRLVVGAKVADAAWADVDAVVVCVGENSSGSTRDLVTPARATQLMAVIAALKSAGARGVERIVIEDTVTVQPHTGALRSVCDLYLSGDRADHLTARPLSPVARALSESRSERSSASVRRR